MQAFSPLTLLKRNSNKPLSCEHCEIFKNTYLENICERLLLFAIRSRLFCYSLHSFNTHSFYSIREFILTMYIFICHSPLTRDKVRLLWNGNQLFLIETMIILSQIDSKKCFLLVFKKPTRFIWNVFHFAQYISRYFAKYFIWEIFRKMQLAFPQCTYMDEWLS